MHAMCVTSPNTMSLTKHAVVGARTVCCRGSRSLLPCASARCCRPVACPMLLFTNNSSTSSCHMLQRPGPDASLLTHEYACSNPRASLLFPAAANARADGVLLKLLGVLLFGRASRGSEGLFCGVGEPMARSAASRVPARTLPRPMGLAANLGDAMAPGVLMPPASGGCGWPTLLLLLLSIALGQMGDARGPAGYMQEGAAQHGTAQHGMNQCSTA